MADPAVSVNLCILRPNAAYVRQAVQSVAPQVLPHSGLSRARTWLSCDAGAGPNTA